MSGGAPDGADQVYIGELLFYGDAAQCFPADYTPFPQVLVDAVPDAEADLDRVREEVSDWVDANGVRPAAPPYVRVNARPWERYVLTLPGTTRHRPL